MTRTWGRTRKREFDTMCCRRAARVPSSRPIHRSRALMRQAGIVLADEILSVGDQAFQEKCLTKIAELRRNGMTLLLVSHSPDQVNKFCDYYVRLDKGRVIEEGRITHKDARPTATPNVRLVPPPPPRDARKIGG